MRLEDFHYPLPDELIARHPVPRGQARLMVVDRVDQGIRHTVFEDLGRFLKPGDCLVLNNTRVIPARLHGRKVTGGHVEVLLVKQQAPLAWECLAHASKPLRPGGVIHFAQGFTATVRERFGDQYRITFNQPGYLAALGEIPLPPYIDRAVEGRDSTDYQTVFARHDGSVAAPTAGLHFTRPFLEDLSGRGIEIVYLTLHVGPGTFLPVRTERIEEHRMHAEEFSVSPVAAAAIQKARAEGRRVIAVGTTTTRVLEHLMQTHAEIVPGEGTTDIFIRPGFVFRGVDALITNFHLPGSTLLMLVSAFGGYDLIRGAYRQAVEERYRFFSYGDAMFIL